MRIKNWQKFQHFKHRLPPWVKLYRDLLDDPEWFALPGDTAKVLVMLWLIASQDTERAGKLPPVSVLAFRLRISESLLRKHLQRLSHWLIQDDIMMISERYHDDASETETETETEKRVCGRAAHRSLVGGGRMKKPTPEEVSQYAQRIGADIDGQSFCDYYEARGWRYKGGVVMKSWQAAVRTWAARQKKRRDNGGARSEKSNREYRETSSAPDFA